MPKAPKEKKTATSLAVLSGRATKGLVNKKSPPSLLLMSTAQLQRQQGLQQGNATVVGAIGANAVTANLQPQANYRNLQNHLAQSNERKVAHGMKMNRARAVEEVGLARGDNYMINMGRYQHLVGQQHLAFEEQRNQNIQAAAKDLAKKGQLKKK